MSGTAPIAAPRSDAFALIEGYSAGLQHIELLRQKQADLLARQPRRTCLGCPAWVSADRLCCPRCWQRLPLKLRNALTGIRDQSVPEAVRAAEYLGRARQMAGEQR